MLVMLRFLVDRYGPPVPIIVPWPILQSSSKLAAMTQVLLGQPAQRPRNSKEGTMALDPGIRDPSRPSKKRWRSSQPLTTEPS
jgi:hypothetical protein